MIGRQVETHSIEGGMLYDGDPRRVPNVSFRRLINVEYNRRGKLVKSKGYSLSSLVSSGIIRDLKKVRDISNNLVGYLVGENLTRFVDVISGSPSIDASFSRCRSDLIEDLKGNFYFISDDGTGANRSIKRWRYTNPSGEQYNAGVPKGGGLGVAIHNLAVTGTSYAYATNVKDTGNDDESLYVIFDIEEGIVFWWGNNHPLFRFGLHCDKIVIPIKTNTLTTSRSMRVRIHKYGKEPTYGASETIFDSAISLDGSSTRVVINLGATIDFGNPDNTFRFFFANESAYGTTEKIVFHRGTSFLINGVDRAGSVTVNDSNASPVQQVYTDREPLIGMRLMNPRVAGNYYYTYALKNNTGSEGNYDDDLKALVNIANSTQKISAISIPSIQTYLNSLGSELNMIDSVIMGSSLVEGGIIYKMGEITKSEVATYSQITSSNFSGWGNDPDDATSIIVSLVGVLLFTNEPTATPMVTSNDRPENLNPLMDSLVKFRNRLWCLARVADANGVVRTFIKYSEVDLFDSWNPLNEVAIPDNLIEIRPYRDEVMMAFSRSKTYRINPIGTDFTWIKIADVGVGGINISDDVGVKEATQMSISTNEFVFFGNVLGIYQYDSAHLTRIPVSLNNLSIIEELVKDNAKMKLLRRREQVWFCGDSISSVTGNNACNLIGDYVQGNLVIRATPDRVYDLIELGDEIDSPLYLGFNNGLGVEGSNYSDKGNPISSTIEFKRFSSSDLAELRLFYFGLGFREETVGSLSMVFQFKRGTTVAKSFSLVGIEGNYNIKMKEVYGTDEWFNVIMTHIIDHPFEITEYLIGGAPYTKKFGGQA